VAALGGGDAGRLLTAVLEGIEAEVREPGDLAAGCVYAKYPAFIARAIAIGNVESHVGQGSGEVSQPLRSFGGAGTQPADGG
jgi:hypothetical protein